MCLLVVKCGNCRLMLNRSVVKASFKKLFCFPRLHRGEVEGVCTVLEMDWQRGSKGHSREEMHHNCKEYNKLTGKVGLEKP